jgi:magnesium transporter
MRKEMFQHEISVLRDTFRRLIRRHAKTNITKLISKTHPADMAVLYRFFTEAEQKSLFNIIMDTEQVSDFLAELDEPIILSLIGKDPPEKIAQLFQKLGANDQADILELFSEEKAQSVLDLLNVEKQEEVEEIMSYPVDSAGSIMTTDVFTLHQNTLAHEAIEELQKRGKSEMVFYLYITDDDNRLTGVISLRDLVTTPPETALTDIMTKTVVSVRPEIDQEEAAKIVARYNYLAIPVVDLDDSMLGIVTVDDVVDVIREEATEDFLQMAGAGKDREILLKSSWENAKSRLPWLFASWVGGIIAAFIIGTYDHMLEATVALAAFIPVIIGMGGNVGTQSSTIVVRGIATGRVEAGGELKLLFKELRVGLILGVLYGLLLGGFTLLPFVEAAPFLGVIVGLSICSSMFIASCIGTVVPLVLRKIDIDPAVATGPFVTTSIDILGVTLYFLIATLISGFA